MEASRNIVRKMEASNDVEWQMKASRGTSSDKLTLWLSWRKEKGASVSSWGGRHPGDASLRADHHLATHGRVIAHAQHRRQITDLSGEIDQQIKEKTLKIIE